MAYIRVAYKTKDGDFDYVPGNRLETLIAQDEISHFFRPAEKRWVSIKFDAVREGGGDCYRGPERRRSGNNHQPTGQECESPVLSEAADSTNWLKSLWRQIENP